MHRYFILLLVAGCSSGQAVKDDSMSAEEHRAAAADHHEQGSQHEGESDLATTTSTSGDPFFGVGGYDLDNYHDTEADRHHALAEQHAAAAERLEAFEEAQCASFPKATRSKCPLLGTVASVNDIENGAELTLVDGINVDAVTAHVQCHHAFARVQGRQGMDSCPMYVEGFAVERAGNVLRMTTSPEQTEELRKRSRAHLNHSH